MKKGSLFFIMKKYTIDLVIKQHPFRHMRDSIQHMADWCPEQLLAAFWTEIVLPGVVPDGHMRDSIQHMTDWCPEQLLAAFWTEIVLPGVVPDGH
ncbi:MAG: hypothetical protein K2L18_03865, partial [Acetatifactor sp.]|nr:hypothetical protein [Acetatifactor sp.]